MKSRLTARLIAGATASVVLVSLGGCFLLPSVGPVKAEGYGGEFSSYFGQSLDWTACGGVDCADMNVPVDWNDPSSETVTIALARQSAYGSSRGTIFVNPGGPGGSGVDFVQYAVTEQLATAFDVIGWDPRGVGASSPVICLDGTAKDESLYGTFENDYLTQGWVDELETETGAFAAACEQNTGALLAHVDTVSTARDLELMRYIVTGDEPLDYVGYSYGTFIGAVYADLFPENVGKFVLDGAVDPTLDAFETLLVQMTGFENGFRAYMTDCLSADNCPFTGTLEEALDQARQLIVQVDEGELVGNDGRTLDSATVGTAAAMALYSESSWPLLSDVFVGIRNSDANPSFYLADFYNDRGDDGRYASNSVEVYQATTCLDNDFAADTASTIDRVNEIAAAAPTIGQFLAYDDFAVLDVMCSNWPHPPAQLPDAYDAPGAAPILVIGTSNDPATPYSWAVSLAEQLSSGVLVSVEGEGHTAYNGDNVCVNQVVDNYFLVGSIPATDPRC
ncbi:MAG: alpha/beta hydrolase [Microbacteriaceae bacterium]